VNLAGDRLWLQDERPKSIRRVYCIYVRPGALAPKGRVVCWIESPDMILDDEPWPFPFTELPLVKFPGIERPDSPLDIPITTPARPCRRRSTASSRRPRSTGT
jgi:hypothetical protein